MSRTVQPPTGPGTRKGPRPIGRAPRSHGNGWDAHDATTLTLGRFFGCHRGSPYLGFFYNSLIESFRYDSPRGGQYPRPLARLHSYVTPIIALGKNGQMLLLGTGGSGRITSFVLQVLSNVLDRGMASEEVVAHPRVAWTGPEERTVELEAIPPSAPGSGRSSDVMPSEIPG